MQIEFNHINLTFENVDGNDERLKRISNLIWKLLDEKFESDTISTSSNSNNISVAASTTNKFKNMKILDEIVVPPIRVNSSKSEYDIASRCATAIYQAILLKLQ